LRPAATALSRQVARAAIHAAAAANCVEEARSE
jgi:hypothetical protein